MCETGIRRSRNCACKHPMRRPVSQGRRDTMKRHDNRRDREFPPRWSIALILLVILGFLAWTVWSINTSKQEADDASDERQLTRRRSDQRLRRRVSGNRRARYLRESQAGQKGRCRTHESWTRWTAGSARQARSTLHHSRTHRSAGWRRRGLGRARTRWRERPGLRHSRTSRNSRRGLRSARTIRRTRSTWKRRGRQ